MLIYIYIYIIRCEEIISVTRNFIYSKIYRRVSTVIHLKPDRFKWSLAFFVELFLLVLTCQPIKEAINEVIIKLINQGSIHIWSCIYRPPSPTPMITKFKIITYLVILTPVPETDATILTVINVKMFTSLFTGLILRCLPCSYSLVRSKNNSYFVGIKPILVWDLIEIFWWWY